MTLIYLDYNATTPVHPKVYEAMLPYIKSVFGNPSSPHALGTEAKKGVDQARDRVARFLGCAPNEVIFTSGGSESNNLAIKGAAQSKEAKGKHIVISSVEHPAVENVCTFLEQNNFRTTRIPVDGFGIVDVKKAKESITDLTFMVSIMHANNEVGSIQPIFEIAQKAREMGALMHTDAAQSAGKVPVRVDELGVDLLSLAGHKLYGPKGIGVLYVRNGVQLQKQIHGAGHEFGFRAGTENVPYMVGLGMACQIAEEELEEHQVTLQRMRDLLHDCILEEAPDAVLNGHPQKRLPNTLNLSFPGKNAAELINAFKGIAVSAGAACHGASVEPSPVLTAMGINKERAISAIRFSLGALTTENEVYQAAEKITEGLKKLNS